jgi:hypothetical protein
MRAEVSQKRIGTVLSVMTREGIDCIMLNRSASIHYLTGASNTCSWIFIRRDGRRLALVLDSDLYLYRQQSTLTDIRSFN